MKSLPFALVALFLLPSSLALATKPSRPLPAGLPLEGKPVAYLHFSDKAGAHVVVITETDIVDRVTSDEERASSKSLFGYQFTRKGEAWTKDWQTKDFVKDCVFDLTLAHVRGSLQVSDVDADGLLEPRFAYALGCRSDVSPLAMKLLLHEGNEKFAVRGSTRVTVDVGEDGKPVYEGGDHQLDPAFKRAPAGLEALAIAVWRDLLEPTGTR